MVKRSDFAAVIFDMDGLVLDTERTYRIAWAAAGRALGIDFTESFLLSLTGMPSAEVMAAIHHYSQNTLDIDEFTRVSSHYWRQHVTEYGIDVKPGFHELHRYLIEQEIPFALASNGYTANVDLCLELSGLDGVFAVKVTRDMVARGKPAPDVFWQAAKLLKKPVHQCLVLEDSAIGIEAAIRSGAIPVLITEQESIKLPFSENARCQFHNLGQVLACIR